MRLPTEQGCDLCHRALQIQASPLVQGQPCGARWARLCHGQGDALKHLSAYRAGPGTAEVTVHRGGGLWGQQVMPELGCLMGGCLWAGCRSPR